MRDFTVAAVLALLLCASGTLRAQSASEVATTPVLAVNSSVEVFPNPATDYVYLRFDDLNANQVNVSLHNIIGNEVPVEREEVNAHEIRIRVKDFAAGYYLAVVQDEQSKFRGTYKFVKR